MTIYTTDTNSATRLAAADLARCLGVMADTELSVCRAEEFDGQPGIYLGGAIAPSAEAARQIPPTPQLELFAAAPAPPPRSPPISL